MRSAAKLSYEQAQAAIDGKPDDKTGPLLEPILKPLWAAYACAWKGREKRQPLEIDAPEHKIIFKDGKVAGVKRRERFDAHKLIEEFMIQANVCAAETLEQKGRPLIYRVHDRPSDEKIAALTDFLPTVDMSWTQGPDHHRGALQPHPAAGREDAEQRHHQRSGAAHAVAGDLLARQYRPLRPEPRALRALHLADPPLRRSHRPPRADPRARSSATTALPTNEEGRLDEIAEHISADRAPLHGRRARRHVALHRALPRRPRRRRVRGPRHRRHALRALHPPGRNPSRRPRAHLLARPRTLDARRRPRTRSSASTAASAFRSACALKCGWKKQRPSAAASSSPCSATPNRQHRAGRKRARACKHADATAIAGRIAANDGAKSSRLHS